MPRPQAPWTGGATSPGHVAEGEILPFIVPVTHQRLGKFSQTQPTG